MTPAHASAELSAATGTVAVGVAGNDAAERSTPWGSVASSVSSVAGTAASASGVTVGTCVREVGGSQGEEQEQ